MKNYLVKSLFTVRDTNWYFRDRADERGMHNDYQQMHQVSLASFEKNLTGTWEHKFLSGEVDNINQAFERTFWYIYDLWHAKPCNILYTDPDTVLIKPLNIWDQFSEFRMFNYTDPRSLTTENIYNKKFEHFYNAGVRYFTATMAEETWAVGRTIAEHWDHTTYDTEQIILNAMLWSQNISVAEAQRPDIAYQAQWLPAVPVEVQDSWNGCSINDTAIVHVHGSRNSKIKLDFMKSLVQHFTQKD